MIGAVVTLGGPGAGGPPRTWRPRLGPFPGAWSPGRRFWMDRDNGAKSRRSARIGSATLGAAAALALLAAQANAAPVLTMSTPTEGARTNGTPSFAGATTDGLDTVKVLVFKGTSATGPHRTLNATPEGSSWSTEIPVSEPLTSESYTAVAEQTEFEILGGIFETATTEPVTFTVDTQPPEVDITKGPEPRSNNVKPAFEGTASENTEVVVHVKLGTTEVASGQTSASAGKWSISTLTKALRSEERRV